MPCLLHANIDFNWGGISPEKLSQNDFSMRWTGRLVAPQDGEYELGLTSDDGVRMWIDGKFVLYEDAGDGYGYEKGGFSTVEFSWDDAGRVLKISDRKGSFEGMKADMDIEISVMDGLSGHGIGRADCRERIRYSGKSLSVKL